MLARTISNMTARVPDFYVYVYVDPRNYEEFYYGKGRGARRVAHLSDTTDSEKVSRINAIRKEGLEPIVRTIAAGLRDPLHRMLAGQHLAGHRDSLASVSALTCLHRWAWSIVIPQ